MELLIAGTGALGCLFAARLAEAGNDVTMMGTWREGLAALHKHGVILHDLDGLKKDFRVKVMEGTACKGSYSQALVLVKSWQTVRVAKQLKDCLSADGIVLTLQNGLGNDETLKEYLSPERVALGVTMVGARMLQPGQVQFTGDGKVFLGAHPGLGAMEHVLHRAGFQVETVQDPTSLLWGKLVINTAINPISALLKVPNGELLIRAEARQLAGAVARETAQVAAEQGITLPYDDPVQAVEDVAYRTGANYSSMLQDVTRGTVTEIDAINGAIVKMGEIYSVPTPINRVLWQLVKSLEHQQGRK